MMMKNSACMIPIAANQSLQPNTPPVNTSHKVLTIAGFMSGTSLDGVDVAILKTDGERILEMGPCLTLPYPAWMQKALRQILGTEILTEDVFKVSECVMDYHVRALNLLLENHPNVRLDLLSVHGQTIFHQGRQIASKENNHWENGHTACARTWQLCLPEILAERFSLPVVFDHRTADIQQGGEGAPLVPIFHAALASVMISPLQIPVAFVNIGGVSNITVVTSANTEDLWAGDVGPGNALINDYVLKHFDCSYDEGGAFARRGRVNHNLLQTWLNYSYFKAPFPKSLDRDDFSGILRDLENESLDPLDGVATLTAFTVQGILHALPLSLNAVIVCGGGRHNLVMMEGLKQGADYPILNCDDVRVDLPFGACALNGDGMEAYAFAYLGARSYRGLPTSFPNTTGVRFPVVGGQLCVPILS